MYILMHMIKLLYCVSYVVYVYVSVYVVYMCKIYIHTYTSIEDIFIPMDYTYNLYS